MTEKAEKNTQRKASPTKGGSCSMRNRQLLWFGVFITIVLIGIIFAIAYHSVTGTRESMEDDVLRAQKNLVSSRAYTMDNWLKDLVNKATMLTTSGYFQLFAAEVNKLDTVPLLFDDDTSDDLDGSGASPGSRLSLMRSQLTEFVAYTNFSTGLIINSRGEPYMSTEPVIQPLSPFQKACGVQVVQTGKVVFGPIALNSDGLGVELYIPIFAPMVEHGTQAPVAVLVLKQQMDGRLGSILGVVSQQESQRVLRMVQRSGDKYQEVVPSSYEIRNLDGQVESFEQTIPFDIRTSISGAYQVYSFGHQIGALEWWLMAEDDASYVQQQLSKYAKTAYSVAALISMVLVLLVSAVWWWLIGREQASINTQFRELLVVIEEQKKFLDGINNTLSDPISLTDEKGVFRYVNRAFAQSVGREEKDVVGLDGPAVFGFDTARRLNAADQHVLMTGEYLTVNDVLYLQSKRYHFQISKAPLRDLATKQTQGIVSVFRDITQLVETEERSRRVIQQTIDALVRTIEEADPFLGGHSRIMGGIAGLMAKQLHLSDADIATIEAAANLSQIGKMFVPREILLKPGALTPEEKTEMEQHVEYSRNVLKDIEFDLPVVETIYQVNETLNGKGYPRGLSGEQISIHARVLAVANSFAAMARPRAYRPAIPVAEVLSILEQQADSYDQDVVAALRQVLSTPAGERIAEQAASVKAV